MITNKFCMNSKTANDPPQNPCLPSPCGANSICKPQNDRALCYCQPGMFGAPPNCRPECIHNSDCPSNRACINENCQDPCIGSCGSNTHCIVQNHRPQCQCMEGYTGDPYSGCNIKQSEYIFLFCCHEICFCFPYFVFSICYVFPTLSFYLI